MDLQATILGPLACFPSELIRKYGSYRPLVGLLGQVISPVTRLLPKQDNTNREKTRTDILASSGIRTHDPSVASETVYVLDRAATVIDLLIGHNVLLTFEGDKDRSLKRLSLFLLWLQFITAAQRARQS
jgi:hypothetical protein